MNKVDLPFGLVLFVLLSVVGGFILSTTRTHRQTLRLQLRLFICAFVLRFATSIVVYQFGFVRVLGDEDASGWMGGVGLQEKWVYQGVGLLDLPSTLLGAFEGHHQGYGYMLGTLFYLTDSPGRLPAAVLNCFFGALTVVFAYRIARILFSSWVAVRVGWVACIFPSLIIWSAQTVKEPIVIFLEMIALYGCVRLKLSGFSLRYILLCGLVIVLMIPFRFYAAYIAGAAVILTLALPRIGKGKVTLGSAFVVAALVISILIGSGLQARQEAEFEKFDLKRVEAFRRNVAGGPGAASGVKTDYDLKTPDGFGLAMAVGAAHLLLAPFPWQLGGGSTRMLLTVPELLVWWWLFFAGVIPGLWYAIRRRFSDIQPLLFFLCGLGLLYSTMFGNVGLAYRQRTQLLPALFIFAMVGIEQWKLRRLATRKMSGNNYLAVAHQRLAQDVGSRSVPNS